MFKRNATDEALETVTNIALASLADTTPGTDNYDRILQQVSELSKLKDTSSKRKVTPDTIALIVGNLVGIGAIIGYERAHVVTSKALGFVMRAR